MDTHDIMQWGALLTLVGGIWWRMRQRDDQIIKEAQRQQKVEDRLNIIEHQLQHHVAADSKLEKKIDELLLELRDIRERIIHIEAATKKVLFRLYNKGEGNGSGNSAGSNGCSACCIP